MSRPNSPQSAESKHDKENIMPELSHNTYYSKEAKQKLNNKTEGEMVSHALMEFQVIHNDQNISPYKTVKVPNQVS